MFQSILQNVSQLNVKFIMRYILPIRSITSGGLKSAAVTNLLSAALSNIFSNCMSRQHHNFVLNFVQIVIVQISPRVRAGLALLGRAGLARLR